MASLARDLSSQFGASVRQRGGDYYRGGRVRIQAGSQARVEAIVRGSERYDVAIERDHDEIRASCTCPYFDTDMCKHIWASILAADAEQFLRGDGRGGRVVLAYDDAGLKPADSRNGDAGEDDFNAARDLAASWRGRSPNARGTRGKPASWRAQLEQVRSAEPPAAAHGGWPVGRELLYVIDASGTRAGRGFFIELWSHDPKKDGTRSRPKLRGIPRRALSGLPDADDRYILAFLAGATELYGAYTYYTGVDDYGSYPARYRLADPQPELILPLICRTGRCRLRLRAEDEAAAWLPLAWDDGEPWGLRLAVAADAQQETYVLCGSLRRGAEQMPLTTPVLLTSGGILLTQNRAARYDVGGAFPWVALLREQRSLAVPAAERDALLAALFEQPALPPLDLPAELRYEEVAHAPRPRLIVKPAPHYRSANVVLGDLELDYGGSIVASEPALRGIVQAAERRILLRDLGLERDAVERLRQLGWRPASESYPPERRRGSFEIASTRLPNAVRELTRSGWYVEAEGKKFRGAGRFDIEVTSGVDWFELHGKLEFGDGVSARLPELLAAVRRGEDRVALDDGSLGLIPEEWLERYGLLTGLGVAHQDHMRFERSQIGWLDALLAAQPDSTCDERFEHARRELLGFAGVAPAEPPPGFRGELRPYQKDGLGWLSFLRRFGFGGCLADDMGLGKTVQVLALLEAQREARQKGGAQLPSLVVVPRSLIFNWQREAARFAPALRVLDYTGASRREVDLSFAGYDVVLTTYGTLRSDVAELKDVAFDYVILDEAQAIKNAGSISAKAVRLLRAEHRLALSGTPIENRLSELFSLFEFLNPGMLGQASTFKSLGARDSDTAARQWLAHALRPFLLRRTKEQVLPELPPKVEQTLYCEMEPKQRKLYDELRDHYRSALLRRIERDGINRAKIQILEALLRLRQASIHPGLIDASRHDEPSAKLDLLLSRLQELRDEGHKTLVFSQFTAMLAIVRRRLDAAGVAYEYLDGRTKNREERVARFQDDADCRLFLVSLKAGGLGLNLTAAEYVFLLDPWWNPAVEAQAVDRAHRIGQAKRVHAYRLIARDTIEEKILELQVAKRDLADAIIGADNALIRTLSKEDLELLLA